MTLRETLVNIRHCIDGLQPIDTKGATMAIDSLLQSDLDSSTAEIKRLTIDLSRTEAERMRLDGVNASLFKIGVETAVTINQLTEENRHLTARLSEITAYNLALDRELNEQIKQHEQTYKELLAKS
jgi:hypothetical protein